MVKYAAQVCDSTGCCVRPQVYSEIPPSHAMRASRVSGGMALRSYSPGRTSSSGPVRPGSPLLLSPTMAINGSGLDGGTHGHAPQTPGYQSSRGGYGGGGGYAAGGDGYTQPMRTPHASRLSSRASSARIDELATPFGHPSRRSSARRSARENAGSRQSKASPSTESSRAAEGGRVWKTPPRDGWMTRSSNAAAIWASPQSTWRPGALGETARTFAQHIADP